MRESVGYSAGYRVDKTYLSLLQRLLDRALAGGARRGLGRFCRRLWCAGLSQGLLGRSSLARELGEKLDRRNLIGLLILKHLEDDVDNLLNLIMALVSTHILVQLTEDVDGRLEVLAFLGLDALRRSQWSSGCSDLTGV